MSSSASSSGGGAGFTSIGCDFGGRALSSGPLGTVGERSRSAAAIMSSIDADPLAPFALPFATSSGLAGRAGSALVSCFCPGGCLAAGVVSLGADAADLLAPAGLGNSAGFLASEANIGGRLGGSDVRPAILASLASCSTWRMQSSSWSRWVVISRAGSGGLIARSCPTRAARAFSYTARRAAPLFSGNASTARRRSSL